LDDPTADDQVAAVTAAAATDEETDYPYTSEIKIENESVEFI